MNKKLIKLTVNILAVISLIISNVVSASDFVITDISTMNSTNEAYMALTDKGTVFKTDNPLSSNKDIIFENVTAVTNHHTVFVLNNGSINYKGKIIEALNVKEIIGIDILSCFDENIVFVDNNSCLKVYIPNENKLFIILENFKEIRVKINKDFKT